MGMLSKELLLQKEKLAVVKVDLDKDNFVYVKEMTGLERNLFELSMLKKNTDGKGLVIGYEQIIDNFRAKLAVLTVCDQDGVLLFMPTDAIRLAQSMGARKLEKIVNAAQELNAITEVDKENIVKNSEAAQVGGSSSSSAEKLE